MHLAPGPNSLTLHVLSDPLGPSSPPPPPPPSPNIRSDVINDLMVYLIWLHRHAKHTARRSEVGGAEVLTVFQQVQRTKAFQAMEEWMCTQQGQAS